MTREHWLAEEPAVPLGDDAFPVPRPVEEEPPHDRFCDLVLTGGVASGVVYPWAIVEIARAFRFRSIGGTSVGAMAAALAAAAEYGRRTGVEKPFEPLRRAPAQLAATTNGRTRMLSLFQTKPHGRRLIRLWGELACGKQNRYPGIVRKALLVLRVFDRPALIGALAGVGLALLLCVLLRPADICAGLALLAVSVALVGACIAAAVLWALASDFRRGVIANDYGLCKGGSTGHPPEPSGIVEWLHQGIQLSAGLDINTDRPLTFRDLWCAPAHPGAERRECRSDDPAEKRSIDLQMITTNLTHGRPYRLPLSDATSRLFYRPAELEGYFPKRVLEEMVKSSKPYAPEGRPGFEPDADHPSAADLYELPRGDLPIVVAARLSLSYPLLFSAVPLWAVDYEVPRPSVDEDDKVPLGRQRVLRRCLFIDGGVSSNFPVHLFDAAVPRWPTFGLWLDRRSPYQFMKTEKQVQEEQEIPDPDATVDPTTTQEEKVWLPDAPDQGMSDNWNRFDPLSEAPPDHDRLADKRRRRPCKPGLCADLGRMAGFVLATVSSATDWRDRTSFRMPHVRNRVARLLLEPREGGLHIGMPREQILEMAHRYGTVAGRKFVARFASANGQPTQAWNEQRWTRVNLLVKGLREHLEGLARSAAWSAHTVPLEQAIDEARRGDRPLRDEGHVEPGDANALQSALSELERLDDVLQGVPPAVYRKLPMPEMRLRPPL